VQFQGSEYIETLKKMSLSKAVPERLKTVKCGHGIGGKNSPIRHIPKQDPIQDSLKAKHHQPKYFKMMLQETEIEMRLAKWASGTLEHFLIIV
jgi:hypothetical protein